MDHLSQGNFKLKVSTIFEISAFLPVSQCGQQMKKIIGHFLGTFRQEKKAFYVIKCKKSCSTLTLLALDKGGLEVSKKVQYISVAQWVAKLQLVKLAVIFIKFEEAQLCSPLSYRDILHLFGNLQTPLIWSQEGMGIA